MKLYPRWHTYTDSSLTHCQALTLLQWCINRCAALPGYSKMYIRACTWSVSASHSYNASGTE